MKLTQNLQFFFYFIAFFIFNTCFFWYLYDEKSHFQLKAHSDFIFLFPFIASVIFYATALFYYAKRKWSYFLFLPEKAGLAVADVFLISCFVLNMFIKIFNESTEWLCVVLVFNYLSTFLIHLEDHLHKYVKRLAYVLLGFSFVLWIYFTIYLIPVMFVGAIVILFFGISIHAFIPMFKLVYTSFYYFKHIRHQSDIKKSFLGGIAMALTCIVLFAFQWNYINYNVKKSVYQSQNNDLPNWVNAMQVLDKNWVTERFLKTNLIYSDDFFEDKIFRLDGGIQSGLAKIQHDPLIKIASLFYEKPYFYREDRIKILENLYDVRYNLKDRLWSGDGLVTKHVETLVELYPDYRLAYTQMKIEIQNQSYLSTPKEAVYVFQLPEGGVMTSLSLWINGKEEPARITTKQKADSAYKNIVGVQQRDPAIATWMEGNQIMVKIFPCTKDENRVFKVGFSTPLTFENENMIYKSFHISGPGLDDVNHYTKVWIEKNDLILNPVINFDRSFKQIDGSSFERNDDEYMTWKATIPNRPLSNQSFYFQGLKVHLEPLQYVSRSFQVQNIYLDLNENWEEDEIETLLENKGEAKLFAFMKNEMILLDENNYEDVLDELEEYEFSMFPFYKMNHPDASIIVTKGEKQTPLLSDLKDSKFYKNTAQFFQNHQNIKVFELSGNTTHYWQTLSQVKGCEIYRGELTELIDLLNNHQWKYLPENEHVIAIQNANMIARISIDSTKNNTQSKAPDHLLRMFAYHFAMKKAASYYFNSTPIPNDVLQAATTGFVVTPFTKLIVLESEADYERFDIKKASQSLQNATTQEEKNNQEGILSEISQNNGGAAPEPHEWALIVIVIIVFVYFWKIKK